MHVFWPIDRVTYGDKVGIDFLVDWAIRINEDSVIWQYNKRQLLMFLLEFDEGLFEGL